MVARHLHRAGWGWRRLVLGAALTTLAIGQPVVAFAASSISLHGAASGANTGTTSVSLPRPGGTASGDVLIAAVATRGTPTISSPAGWTRVRTDARKSAATQSMFVHVAGSSEPTTYTFTLSASETAVGTIAAYTGVDTADPVVVHAGQPNGKSTSATAPSITPGVADSRLVAFFGITGKATVAPPSGMTEQAEVVSPSGTSSKMTAELADQALSSGAATGTRSAALSKSLASIGQLVALRGSGSGGSTNHAPVANDDSYSVDQGGSLNVPAGTGVLGNDNDADGDSLTATRVGNVSHGTVTLNSNGGFSYTPTSSYTGDDSFTYRANDGTADSNLATVTITVSAGPPPPPPGDTLYVDRTNGSCNDGGPGSASKPFCTIGQGASVVGPGQTVYVVAGTYAETVTVGSSGTSSKPITFSAAPGVVVTGGSGGFGFRISGRSYVIVQAFTVRNTSDDGIHVTGSDHITISGIHVSLSGSATSGGSAAGIYFSGTTASSILGNAVERNTDDGISINSGSSGNLIEDNVSFGNARQYTRAAGGIQLNDSPSNTVRHNTLYGNEDSGIGMVNNAHDELIVGNLSYGNGDHGIDNNKSPNNTIVGNTIHGNVTTGINLEGSPTGSGGATLANNLLMDNGLRHESGGGTSGGQPGNIRVSGSSLSGTHIDYDLLFQSGGGVQIVWNNTQYTSLSAFQNDVSGQETHGVQGNPKLASPAPIAVRPASAPWGVTVNTGDYHIGSGSPAIDSADSGAPGETTSDIEGTGRFDDPATAPNTGTGPRNYDDRGAYEFK
jgi:parallel beta-helix repeat protein